MVIQNSMKLLSELTQIENEIKKLEKALEHLHSDDLREELIKNILTK